LEKRCEEIKASGETFEHFVDRMDRWLEKNCQKAVDLFRRYDVHQEGVLTYEEFKSGEYILGKI
jgi:Ca2+-binding EF-hand superfamily protein